MTDSKFVIPRPAHTANLPGAFVLSSTATISTDDRFADEAALLAEDLGRVMSATPKVTGAQARGPIHLEYREAVKHPEGYELIIGPEGIVISASSAAGAFYGCQTLWELVYAAIANAASPGRIELAGVKIEDEPRFGWRGLMLDVSRHFYTADQVCRLLDLMALHKLNKFHWHLTDDQGWRLPVRRYPLLTEIGSKRKCTTIGLHDARPRRYDDQPYGGHYTAEEIRRVVAYAARRHITIVPEIDMPGHMQAAVAAYPELGNIAAPVEVRCHWGVSHHILNPQPSTVKFMQNVLEEVMELFPGKFIHVGGDEAHKHEWTESRVAQDRMAELGLKSEAELQSWFIRQMDEFLTARGRRLIGWDEILEGGLAPGAAVMSWRGIEGGIKAASAGHDVVMSPHTGTYLDYYQAGPEGEPLAIGGMISLEKAYSFEAIPSELDASQHHHILGGQGQLWTEYIASMDLLEYMAFPRVSALAETFWSRAEHRDWNDFKSRMHSHRKLLEHYKVRLGPIPV